MGSARSEEILKTFGREKRAVYSLDNIRRALAAVGDPQKTVYSLIVSGTNGKGTCSLLVSGGLAEAGFKVHTFLSPHLCSARERFLTNLEPITEDSLAGWLERYLPIAREYELSYFEILTLVAFLRAKEEKCDFLVLEVGLGGRLDATNLCDPLASVISSIGLDHQEILGNDEATILREKLAIVRPEGLLFTGVQDEALVQQIEQHCLDIDAIPYYSRELKAEVEKTGLWGQTARINGYPFELTCPARTTLENAKTSLLLLRILFPKIDLEVFRKGFRRVLLPARFECLQESPRVLLSGDHNPAAVDSLLETLRSQRGEGRLFILSAFSPDKDFESMIPRLREISDWHVLSFIPGYQNQMPENYLKFAPDTREHKEIIEEMLQKARPEDTILITGSLYMAGAVRPFWSNEVRFGLTDQETLERFGLTEDPSSPTTLPQREAAQTLVP